MLHWAGNPFVTPDTTRDVVITARLSAVNVFFDAIEKLMFELSIWRCSPEMQARSKSSTSVTRILLHGVHLHTALQSSSMVLLLGVASTLLIRHLGNYGVTCKVLKALPASRRCVACASGLAKQRQELWII